MSPHGTIRVAVLDSDRLVSAAVSDGLSAQTGIQVLASVREEAELMERINASEPDVVVLDLASVADSVPLIRSIHARHPSACVVVTGRNAAPMTVGRAVAAGAATFVPKPYRPEDLVTVIRELGQEFTPRVSPARPATKRSGSIIAVYSPKGGVGTTTIATSLAIALAARATARVAIVDLDLQFGDVGVLLDVSSKSSIADLLGQAHLLDDSAVSEIFKRHSTGIFALPAPEEPTDMRSVDVVQVVEALKELRSRFDFIVCDLWSGLEELALGVLRAADRVVIVTTPEIPALRHVRRVMNATTPLFSSDRTVVVANRVSSKIGVSQSEMERAIGLPVAVSVPSDGIGVTKAINEGMSVLDPRARTRVARSFHDLADLVARGLLQPAQHVRVVTPTEATAS